MTCYRPALFPQEGFDQIFSRRLSEHFLAPEGMEFLLRFLVKTRLSVRYIAVDQ